MTKKRFTETVSDTVTGREYKCEMGIDDDLLELLNEQHEQIQELYQEIDFLTHFIEKQGFKVKR